MRQITGLLLNCIKAIPISRIIVSAIILSYSYSVVAADTNPVESNNTVEITSSSAAHSAMSTHTVVVGDTLWSVAMQLRPDNMSMAEAMDSLYENNPEAFLEGDSTKLIEGSVVTFATGDMVNKPSDTLVSQENSTLIIPTVEVAEDISVELDVSQEVIADTIRDATEVDQSADAVTDLSSELEIEMSSEPLVDPVEILDENIQIKVSDAVVNQPVKQSNFEISKTNSFSIEQLKRFLINFDAKDFNLLVSRVKQLPIDFWIFVGALCFAMIINRSRKLDQRSKENIESSKEQKPIETVLEGPFADGSDDDVFADSTDNKTVDVKTQKDPKIRSEDALAINLPGVEELEAQMREDDDQGSDTGKVLGIDFEEDTLEIDPLQIKLDMASLCIEMADIESAQSILEEIIGEADKSGKAKAREILDSIET
ncbi:MAG: FimV/HubP family polar landmark protein [Porticoccaceae bacterium]